ncbi:hypothetical protein L1887_42608 [Cichorium endivia]|nr:hypothetical protein L1887_42608 [Cichorium endivia]
MPESDWRPTPRRVRAPPAAAAVTRSAPLVSTHPPHPAHTHYMISSALSPLRIVTISIALSIRFSHVRLAQSTIKADGSSFVSGGGACKNKVGSMGGDGDYAFGAGSAVGLCLYNGVGVGEKRARTYYLQTFETAGHRTIDSDPHCHAQAGSCGAPSLLAGQRRMRLVEANSNLQPRGNLQTMLGWQ